MIPILGPDAQPLPPARCRSVFAGMRCTERQGHLYQNPPEPHACDAWRWNRRAQWTVDRLPLPPGDAA